eukprot:9238073-Prorocentrum_lima.AAC.1
MASSAFATCSRCLRRARCATRLLTPLGRCSESFPSSDLRAHKVLNQRCRTFNAATLATCRAFARSSRWCSTARTAANRAARHHLAT